MTDKKKTSSLDSFMQDYLKGMADSQQRLGLMNDIASTRDTDSIGNAEESDTSNVDAYYQAVAEERDLRLSQKSRDLGEHAQDLAAGTAGTIASMGGAAVAATNVIYDALGNIPAAVTDDEATWENTAAALEGMQSVNATFQDLKSAKSQAFARVSGRRQGQAVKQAELSAMSEDRTATTAERLWAGFGAGAGAYVDNPGQLLTDSVAQLPYALTGGIAKGITQGTKLANPLIAQLSKKMSVEAATKLVNMGIVGGLQGQIEGLDIASVAYARVKNSTDTFTPEQEAERETAALKAAFTAYSIAAPISTITGVAASKFELAPFGAKGGTMLSRSGDNVIKGLLEGTQETIESGTSQFASNYAGNKVLSGGDQVSLDEGVGAAAGTGFAVGTGSTVITNPRAMVDAVGAPLALAGEAINFVGNKADARQRAADTEATNARVDKIVAGITTPAARAAAASSQTDDGVTPETPIEKVELPTEMALRAGEEPVGQAIRTFANGMEYLKGKDMNSVGVGTAWHVLGEVMGAANTIKRMRDGAEVDAANESLSPEERATAAATVEKLGDLVNNDKLSKWVELLPSEDIESELEDLRQTPERFAQTVAHLATMSPLKVSAKLATQAFESKGLSPDQRKSIELARELQEAAAELKGHEKPNSEGVSRSMMQTGFPGSSENDSVAGYLNKITQALAEGDQDAAQIAFHRLVKFSNFEQRRAAVYEATKKEMAKDPNSQKIELPGYYQLGDNGKVDKTKLQFVSKTEKGQELVKAIRNDADAIAKMVAAIQKRTGLEVAEKASATKKPTTAPVAKPNIEKAAPAPAEKAEAPKAALVAGPLSKAASDKERASMEAMSDEALAEETTSLAKKIRARTVGENAAKVRRQNIRYNNLAREKARRTRKPKAEVETKPVVDEVADAATRQPARDAHAAVVAARRAARGKSTAAAPAAPVVEVESKPSTEKSKNWFTNLMPSYFVADGSSVADKNDRINHLTQSFTKSDKPGLLSKLPKSVQNLVEMLGLTDEGDIEIAGKIAGLKSAIKQRLQTKIQNIYTPEKVIHMMDRPLWQNANAHSLYAAIWDDVGNLAYDPIIADVMAWTGIQHMLDLAYPMNWSQDKKSEMIDTYGPDILELLADGWVPMQDQIQQLAKKLQVNLELKAPNDLSTKYTEGTMLALAVDIMSVMFPEAERKNQEGKVVVKEWNGPMTFREMTTLEHAPVPWINVAVLDRDLLIDTATVMEDFFPERANSNAGVVGKPQTNVNPFYRDSQQEISQEQKEANQQRGSTPYFLSPLLLNLWDAIPDKALERLLGWKVISDKAAKDRTLSETDIHGANTTIKADLTVISNHIKRVRAFFADQKDGKNITEVPSYFEHEQVTNGRSMTKGVSPQSSKWYREMFSAVQKMVDPRNPNKNIGFRMAVAQGMGSKMDKRQVSESLKWMEVQLAKPEVQRALEAAYRFGHGDMTMIEEDLTALENSGIEMTPHAISALVHWAEYQQGKPFASSLNYEIDGLTDGPINLMMLMGLHGGAKAMESWLKLGGLFFGGEKISVQDRIEEIKQAFGAPDLYGIIANKATRINRARGEQIYNSVEGKFKTPEGKWITQKQAANQLLKDIDHLILLAGLAEEDADGSNYRYLRGFTKKPTQASGYLQGKDSIVKDLANNLLNALSVRMDAGLMTAEDTAAMDNVFGTRLGWSDKHERFYVMNQDEGYSAAGWKGKPLTAKQFKALVSTLTEFGGYGLAEGTLAIIGPQRAKLMAANNVMAAQINYAQKVLQEKYKEKQAAEVAAGNLRKGDPLSRKDENALIKQVWETLVPHPVLRNTKGLPTASTQRSSGMKNTVSPVQGLLFGNYNKSKGTRDINFWLSDASFEEPGVRFGALSIMAAGDGSMMTGFFSNNKIFALDMYDGIYIDPEMIDEVGDLINKEVKENWKHNFIQAILDSVKLSNGFTTWAKSQPALDRQSAAAGISLWEEFAESNRILMDQGLVQEEVKADIESRDRSYSHMAGHNNAHWVEGTALESTSLGTTETDPLLDLASDSLGHEANGIRKMSAADVKVLLKDHTFENPVLSGLWKVLAPLINDNLVLFMSSDRKALADFYQQNEDREMRPDVDGISVGDHVYIRAINAETFAHELLHATTKNLTATYFTNPNLLTAQQRKAIENLGNLMQEFMRLDADTLTPLQAEMVEHVQAVVGQFLMEGDPNRALQEFLAYGLTNYHLQRTLGTTKTTLGKLLESIFNAVKALFGFPNGTQSDSMLAQMLSNFEVLTAGASNMTLPVTVDEALESVNPKLARSFSQILNLLEKKASTTTAVTAARADGRIRLQEISKVQHIGNINLFPAMSPEELLGAEYIQAMFSVGLQVSSRDSALLVRIVDAVRNHGYKAWKDNADPVDQIDNALAQARYDFFFANPANKNDQVADILSMAMVNKQFAGYMEKIILPTSELDKDSFNDLLDSFTTALYTKLDGGVAIKKDTNLSDALEVAALRMRHSMMQSAKRKEAKPGPYRRLTDKLTEGLQFLGEKAGKTADARQQKKGTKDFISSSLMLFAGTFNDNYADMLGKWTLEITNQMDNVPAREGLQEMVGTNSYNYKLIQLKGKTARMVSAVRQSFREQFPIKIKSWFTDLEPEQDELLHKVIGKTGLYGLSQEWKDRLEELLTENGVAYAITDVSSTLMAGGDHGNKKLMIAHAKRLGNRMAGMGIVALYANAQAIATLEVEGGAAPLTPTEMQALEDLITMQALSHLTPTQRRATLALLRDNTEGFWKTTLLLNTLFDFDTKRAGTQTATLNFQKGWIPTEDDPRKKLKLFNQTEVRAAERLGWVVVPGNAHFEGEPSMVYMATEVGITPTLSGGAIHAVEMHMNGIHYASGLPTDPSVQTIINHPRAMRSIKDRILKGEVIPYSALFDASGDVVGFQRQLDPKIIDRHTKTVGRISEAAGIWMGRIHEEQAAQGLNRGAAKLLRDTWEEAKLKKTEDQFVDIRTSKDPVIANVWKTLPYNTKLQLEKAYGNKPIMVRKDQVLDAIGYHKASVGNFFTGDNRWDKEVNTSVSALARQFLGKGAYKYLVNTEAGWQSVIGTAKNTIIVKSLTILLNNLASNQLQLLAVTGNPLWNVRVQAAKHRELVSYLGYQRRIARLVADGYSTTDANLRTKIDAEKAYLHREIEKLSIWPLIESGDLPSIAEGVSQVEEYSWLGDMTAKLEQEVGKLPEAVGTVIDNIVISKETSIYKFLDRGVQYGDFVAKAAMYEWLVTNDKATAKAAWEMVVNDKNPDPKLRITMKGALSQIALMEINDEFVNYTRLPGRMRTYGDDMGLTWFYHYKLRIMKMTFRRLRKNPISFLIGSQVGGMLGIPTLVDTLPGIANWSYATGLDPLYTAHETHLMYQIVK